MVHRHTELDELLARHGTRGQAAFYLAARGRDLAEVEGSYALQRQALAAVSAAIPPDWRRGAVERADLSRFLFAADDIVIVVGQDEAWPSPATAITLTEGFLTGTSALTVISESEGLVAFGDGIETDALTLSWGQQVTLHAAEHRLQLLR